MQQERQLRLYRDRTRRHFVLAATAFAGAGSFLLIMPAAAMPAAVLYLICAGGGTVEFARSCRAWRIFRAFQREALRENVRQQRTRWPADGVHAHRR